MVHEGIIRNNCCSWPGSRLFDEIGLEKSWQRRRILNQFPEIESSFFVSPSLIARRWVIRGNWPYCWWRCSRVSRFSIYVAFSIIIDSYHTSLVFDFDIFSIAIAQPNRTGGGKRSRDFRRLNWWWHTFRSRWFCPSVCSRSYQSSFGGDENTQKGFFNFSKSFSTPDENHIVYPQQQKKPRKEKKERKRNQIWKRLKNRWRARAHGIFSLAATNFPFRKDFHQNF